MCEAEVGQGRKDLMHTETCQRIDTQVWDTLADTHLGDLRILVRVVVADGEGKRIVILTALQL